jgi:hypothetical protein
MEMNFCPNCGKRTGYKRALGFGTFFALLLTAGFWLLALPFYPKRCIACGLSKTESVPWYRTWRLGLVLAVGVVAFGTTMYTWFPPSRPVVITKGPDYDKPASSEPVQVVETPASIQSERVSDRPTIAPDVIDPTHSTQWMIGGIPGHELFRRMSANSSGPLAVKGVMDNWTSLELVYSDSQENIYIEADAVEVDHSPALDLGWANLYSYLQRVQRFHPSRFRTLCRSQRQWLCKMCQSPRQKLCRRDSRRSLASGSSGKPHRLRETCAGWSVCRQA